MKTKFTLTVIAVAGFVFLATFHMTTANNVAQNITPTFTTSRYMMFGGNYSVSSELAKGKKQYESSVFKIDSYTGKVWILKAKQLPSGERVESWKPVSGDEAKQIKSSQVELNKPPM